MMGSRRGFLLGLLWATATALAASAEAVEKRSERGPVSAVVELVPERVPIGDAVTLTIEVRAEAGVELLMPVFGASLERFQVLEFVPREEVDADGNTLARQTYRLQAPISGSHSIPPITVEFVDRRAGQRAAPEDEDAYELLTERLEFEVESVVPADAGSDLKPPLGPLQPLDQAAQPSWLWLLAGLLVCAIVALLLWWQLGWGKARRRQSAYRVALNRLDALQARPRPTADQMDAFFVELSALVRGYLEDRFALHAPELTTEEFLDVAAQSPDLNRHHRSFLQTFLGSADQVKFARFVPPAEEVETALSAVRDFLRQTSDEEAGHDTQPNKDQGVAHA